MSARNIAPGSTDQTLVVWCYDADGEPVVLAHNSAGLTLAYRRDSNGREGTPVSMTPVPRLVAGTHRDGAITSKGGGKHEVDISDAGYIAGADSVVPVLTADGVETVIAEKAVLNSIAIPGLFTGMTSLAHWLRALARADGGVNSTAVDEINAGGGEYFNEGHSLQTLQSLIVEGAEVDPVQVASELAQMLDGNITLTGPVMPSGRLLFTRGMDYHNSDSRAATITDSTGSWPNLTGATPYLVIKEQNGQFPNVFHITGTVVGLASVRFELTAAQTAILTQSNYLWGSYATLPSGRKVDLVRMGKNLIVGDMPLTS